MPGWRSPGRHCSPSGPLGGDLGRVEPRASLRRGEGFGGLQTVTTKTPQGRLHAALDSLICALEGEPLPVALTSPFRGPCSSVAEDCTPPGKALGRPLLLHLIVHVESTGLFREGKPRDLGPNKDVDVGLNVVRAVQGCNPKKSQLRATTIVAPDGDSASGASIDVVRATALGWHRNRLRHAREDLKTVRLDQCVDGEGAARVPLAIRAMATVDKHRGRQHSVPHFPATAHSLKARHIQSPDIDAILPVHIGHQGSRPLRGFVESSSDLARRQELRQDGEVCNRDDSKPHESIAVESP